MVHRRELNGETLVFGVHGALWGNAMTWWDHDTGSIWSQPLGEAIAGPRKGQTVDMITSEFTTWRAWRDEHPDSLARNQSPSRQHPNVSCVVVRSHRRRCSIASRSCWGANTVPQCSTWNGAA